MWILVNTECLLAFVITILIDVLLGCYDSSALSLWRVLQY